MIQEKNEIIYVNKQQAGPVIVYAGLNNFMERMSIICS